MMPTTLHLMRSVADRHYTDIHAILSRYGPREMTSVRAEAAHVLKNNGYTITNIARLLRRDRHTIYKWLIREVFFND
jgi:Homeodomain-like domain-containing protein